MEARFKAHRNGKGAAWTRLYKPIKVLERRDTGLIDESEVAQLEDDLTLDVARQYGFENVRGGQWCRIQTTYPLHVTQPDGWIKIA